MPSPIIVGMFLLTGCDVDEGPKEEAREALEAIKKGKPLEEVGAEIGDVAKSIGRRVDRKLRSAETWVDKRIAELERDGKSAGSDLDKELRALRKRIKRASRDLEQAGEGAADDFQATLDEIEAEIERLTNHE